MCKISGIGSCTSSIAWYNHIYLFMLSKEHSRYSSSFVCILPKTSSKLFTPWSTLTNEHQIWEKKFNKDKSWICSSSMQKWLLFLSTKKVQGFSITLSKIFLSWMIMFWRSHSCMDEVDQWISLVMSAYQLIPLRETWPVLPVFDTLLLRFSQLVISYFRKSW